MASKLFVDFSRLYSIHLKNALFVFCTESDMRFKRMCSRPCDRTKGVRYDKIGRLEGRYSKKGYQEKLRRITHYDGDVDREFIFLTNNMNFAATEIAYLY